MAHNEKKKLSSLKLGALWIQEGTDEDYLSGSFDLEGFGRVRIRVYKNKYKKEDRHPDYNICIVEDDIEDLEKALGIPVGKTRDHVESKTSAAKKKAWGRDRSDEEGGRSRERTRRKPDDERSYSDIRRETRPGAGIGGPDGFF